MHKIIIVTAPVSQFDNDLQFWSRFPSPVLLVSSKGVVEHANPAFTQLLGSSSDFLQGQPWYGLDVHLTLIKWKQHLKEAHHNGKYVYDTDLSTDGEILYPVTVQLIAYDSERVVIFIEDRLAIERQEAEWQLLTEQSGVATWSYDPATDTWRCPTGFFRLLGANPEKAPAYCHGDCLAILEQALQPDSYKKFQLQFKAALEEGTSFEMEWLLSPDLPNQRLLYKVKALVGTLQTIQLVGTLSAHASRTVTGGTDRLTQFSIDHAPYMIIWVKEDGTLAYHNQSFRDRLGYTSEELVDMRTLDFVLNDTQEDRKKHWAELYQRQQLSGDIMLVPKDAQPFPARFRTNLIRLEDQELACVYLRDITTTKRQEQLLKLTQFTTDNSPELIFWTRPDGSFSYINKSVAEKLQYQVSDFEQMEVSDIAPYFDRDVLNEFWRNLRKDKYVRGEYDIFAKDGSTITVFSSVSYIKYGDQEIACSLSQDITDEKIQRVRRELSEVTLDQSVNMILWINQEGNITYCNQTFKESVGYKGQTIERQPITRFLSNMTLKKLDQIWKSLRQNDYHNEEMILTRSDSQTLPVRVWFNYLKYHDQEYCAIYLKDVRKKKARELRLKLSEATFTNASEIILWLQPDGKVYYFNNTLLEYIGGHRKDWEGKKLSRVLPQLDLKQVVPGTTLEYSMPSAEGGTVYLELSFAQVEQEGINYYMIVGRNFTERYLRRQQIEEARLKIEALSTRLQEENIVLRQEAQQEYSINNIITVSPNYQKILSKVGQVAETSTTVLILGETGTGKELLARAVHTLSDRAERPFIKINCAAIPENLFESELFGHEKGAFTGALERKKGKFELANRGTIFLDEIGEMPLSLQAKLLRAIQEGEIERLGGHEVIKVDVRLVAATNRSLEEMVREGKFRADLYYRLNVFPIVNLPLRERPQDIEVLTEHFVQKFAQRQGKKIERINAPDMKRLERYRFPGNVRELENIIERAVVLCKGNVLNIPFDDSGPSDVYPTSFPTFEEMQRIHIIKALQKTNGRITGPEGAGRLLGLNDRTLMSKMRKLDIKKKEYVG